ncbi:MAG: capsule biosynthesis protein [Rhodobacteraceae bacterium]|nr:capsule biosynthesis protein [Paracoccaceae bacterium]
MTMKPKAKKYRLRPLSPQGQKTAPADVAPQPQSEVNLDAIRREGLTGRQLRMARRVAQKHGLAPTSDYDAVRLLREKGINPFKRDMALDLVTGDTPKPDETKLPVPKDKPTQAKLPVTKVVDKSHLPSTDVASPSERRAAEIMKVQRDLVNRRRRKMLLLMTRLAFFVFLPTFLAGFYYYVVATPMYATKSEFLILKAESGGNLGGLFSGTQFATNQDAIAVQSYLQSKDAMLRLDKDVGFKAHYTQEWIDPIQRMSENPSNEEAYRTYKRNIEIGYDPTEGVIRMEIAAAEPSAAAAFSAALIGYAEERVDNLSLRKRSNAVADATQGLEDAEEARAQAQEKLVRLQQEGSIVDPEGRITALRGQINNIEVQIQEKSLDLQAQLDNARPNAAKVEGLRGDIRRLNTLLTELNAQMTTASAGETSLAEVSVQIQLAQADLATRDLMLQAALERLEQARRDADSQARYLTTSVEPVASEDPSYPRAFENTILAFLIFSGIYLMISITASILREQVST